MANQAAVQKIMGYGVSRERAEEWLAEHPGDEGRIDSAFGKSPTSAAAPKPATASPAAAATASPASSGIAAAAGGTGVAAAIPGSGGSASMGGLDAAAGLGLSLPPDPTSQVLGTASGALRPLGQRIPSMQSMELASRGKRVY